MRIFLFGSIVLFCGYFTLKTICTMADVFSSKEYDEYQVTEEDIHNSDVGSRN